MTLTSYDLMLYTGAVFVLFLTPGPVWLALTARTLSGGFSAAWPLALGVVFGDMLWPVLAYLGVSWLLAASAQVAMILKFIAFAMFTTLGVATLRNSTRTVQPDNRLTRPGVWSGFSAGVIVILSNPKAVLFYMGLLPGFFNLTKMNAWDLAAIVGISQIVPLIGNLALAAFVHRVRNLLSSSVALKRVNVVSGILLICVGLIILFT